MATMTSAAPYAKKTDPDSPESNLGNNPYNQNAAPQLPMMNGSTMQSPIQLTPEAMGKQPKQTPTQTGNEMVLGKAQQAALNQPKSPVSGLVQQRTEQLLKDPNLGFNYGSYNQNQMDQYNANASKAMEATRQGLADTSQSGELQSEFLKNVLTVSQGRATQQSQLDYNKAQEEQKNYLNALSQGREGMVAQQGETASQIGNLATVRGMAEGERSQAQGQENTVALANLGFDQDVQKMAIAQGYDLAKLDKTFGNEMARMVAASNLDTASKTTLMNLQDQIDTGRLMKTQDFEAIQNNLNRLESEKLQKDDIAGQLQVQALRGQIDAKAQQAQNEFARVERVATQSWQTGERVSEQDYQAATNYFNQAQENARQEKDIEGEKIIADMRIKTYLQMQTQEMEQQEKMAYIGSQIAEAKANNDVGRERAIISFQTTQELEKMAAAGEIDNARMNLQAQIDDALAQKDYTRTDALQTSRMVFEGNEKAKDRVLDEFRLSLEEKSQKASELFQAFDAGAISIDSVLSLVKPFAKEMGITVTAPDPMATEKEIIKEFNQTKLQFALTHPELAVAVEGQITGLNNSPEAQKAFNDFMNKTYYGATGTEKGTSPETAILYDPSKAGEGGIFSITPPDEGQTFKSPGGDVFTRDPGNVSKYNGVDSYSAVTSGGEKVQVIAGHGIKYSSGPQLIFDPSIPKSEVDKIIALSTEGGNALPYNLTTKLKSLGYAATSWGGNPYDSDYTIKKA